MTRDSKREPSNVPSRMSDGPIGAAERSDSASVPSRLAARAGSTRWCLGGPVNREIRLRVGTQAGTGSTAKRRSSVSAFRDVAPAGRARRSRAPRCGTIGQGGRCGRCSRCRGVPGPGTARPKPPGNSHPTRAYAEPERGFEPLTCALRVRCSTTELPGQTWWTVPLGSLRPTMAVRPVAGDRRRDHVPPRHRCGPVSQPPLRRNETRPGSSAILDRPESLVKVGKKVLGVLETEADADEPVT